MQTERTLFDLKLLRLGTILLGAKLTLALLALLLALLELLLRRRRNSCRRHRRSGGCREHRGSGHSTVGRLIAGLGAREDVLDEIGDEAVVQQTRVANLLLLDEALRCVVRVLCGPYKRTSYKSCK